ncbi:MAG TPA: DUF371 domain-containing protein [Candidatus Bathyarchaeia archaeon]
MKWALLFRVFHSIFHAYGHPAILSTHPTTLEITTSHELTHRGDCVVAVKSSSALRDLPVDLKRVLSSSSGRGRLRLQVGPFEFTVEGTGDPRLTFSHETDLVVRKSGFVSDRTLMIHANKSSMDIPRDIVRLLQDPTSSVTVEISAIDPGQL